VGTDAAVKSKGTSSGAGTDGWRADNKCIRKD
jgi:hypothetical protein